ncbi:CocE/NonD family hydrolase [Halosimplex amylolyticum]|uniref:CocE/NonD family hydrolase n=1 Tax=Halosimplex amylolyticum TaxID=3396616 RepID=UPI003F54F507
MSNSATDGDEGERAATTSTGSLSRRRLLAAVSATGIGGGALASRAVAGSSGTERGADRDGPAPIREEAWVETEVDTDGDGDLDRVYVRVSRPESTDGGEPVPVIARASPYYAEQTHGDTTPEMLYDRAIELSADGASNAAATDSGAAASSDGVGSTGGGPGGSPSHRPPLAGRAGSSGAAASGAAPLAALERRYLRQGYAVALISTLGTHESTGCYTAAGPETARAIASVVDWFNGRVSAYDAKSGGETVTADWATGKTGMIGTSANGELANAAATTGVDGLEAIVPNSANNGQYSLFRSNGTPISVVKNRSDRIADLSSWVAATNVNRSDCEAWAERTERKEDHETGDYNDFWHEREFLPDAEDVEAAVLVTHGVDDPIVKPNNGADWYEMLDRADVPLKLWLHGGRHAPPRGDTWESLLDRWWAHWLKGEDNGVMDEDPVTVVHGARSVEGGSAETYETWPVPGTEPATVRLTPGGASAGGVGVEGNETAAGEESFVDDSSTLASDLVAVEESAHRLRYETPPLTESVHVSGKVVPSLALSFDDPTVVSAALVEFADEGAEIVTRGWADPLNRPSYGEYDSPVAYKQSLRESSPVESGERVEAEFPLQATDHVFEAGSRIGLVVYASDRLFTLHPPGDSEVRLSLAETTVDLPVVGGASALAGAFASEATATGTGSADAATATDGAATDPGAGEAATGTAPSAVADGAATEDGTDDGATTEDGTDDATDAQTVADGPGFGVASAVAALGGAGRLLQGRLDGEE